MTDAFDPFENHSTGKAGVVSAVEETERSETLVVADITQDDAWLTMATDTTVSTHEWR